MLLDADRERLRHVRPQVDLPPVVAEAVALVVIVALIAVGVLVGVLAGHENAHQGSSTVTVTSPR